MMKATLKLKKFNKVFSYATKLNNKAGSYCFGNKIWTLNARKRNYSTETKSFVRGLFLGKIEAQEVFPFPETLTEEAEQTLTMIVPPIQKFFDEQVDAAKNDSDAKISDSQWQQMKELGLFGLQVPQELGGVGLTNVGYARMVEIVGGVDLGVGIALGAHQSIGFKGISLAGTPEQKEKYLPALASGENVAAFCLTEPSSGSDANSIKSRAVLSEDGKHYVLNGSKIWISNGGIAEIMTVFAQTPVKDEKGVVKDKVTAFIVERSFGGVTNGNPESKMGIKCSNTAEVYFEDVKIPVENVLGQVGEGFKVAMAILNNGRFGMGAALSGTMKVLIKQAAAHANTRKQFGSTLRSFGVIQEKFAKMNLKLYAAESMAYLIAANMDKGSQDYQLEAAISKFFASQAASDVADECLQILAGMGFMKETGVERVVRDLRIFRIFEGTNEILRLFVALTGMQSAGKELRKLMSNPIGNLGTIISKGMKSVGLGGSVEIKGVHKDLQSSSDLLGKGASVFSTCVQSLLVKYKKQIAEGENQMVVNRIAGMAMDLFSMAAVLSRATRALEKQTDSCQHEKLLAETWCRDSYKNVLLQSEGVFKEQDTTDKAYLQIANEFLDNGEYKPTHVIGL